ncbi:Phytoene desaturase [Patulibacter medicamentivorans]|uniref:Phytoene desaturase n=1 Tax=Patulibacter medicamentivorans TaxID=1097667 RepID=H0EBK6_9ACTN|nr:FAD-dependent oxidoreductase [Patulibacter medicamentivorans]EHN08953.1 Phytoene desaturase [Patulibacter medicamentivorans]
MGDGEQRGLGQQDGVSRRRFLRDAGAVGAIAATSGVFAGPARAATSNRRVAVLGGGMAGLAAAHELAERGFQVTVYERNALGGKARSIPVAGTGRGGRRDLPGEHGFRFFPGFYHHVPDTMRRIPFPGNPGGVRDNLVAATGGKFLRNGDRADAGPFGLIPDPVGMLTPDGLRRQLTDWLSGYGIPPHELVFFVERLLVFLTSCDARRFGQWEHVSWWDFIRAEGKSQEYKTVAAAGMTRNVVAAKETVASTRTIGNMAEAFLMTMMNRGNDGALDRVLDLPTNEAWIDPWVAHLQRLGVRFEVGQAVDRLEVGGGRVTAAWSHDARRRRYRIDADWFVCAMPVERARKLWSPEVLAVDPSLKQMDELFADWMVGIQYFLKRKVDITRGHITFIDAPWALTGLTQGQFWNSRDFGRDYGDGTAVDALSIDISNWDAPGILYGKPAKRCTPDQIAREVWAQIKAHGTAAKLLPDDIVHSWFLDPGIVWNPKTGANRNVTPLLVNTVGSWDKRPTARTKLPNLFLAGDYVQTNIDLATMEGANESGRAAVNALLETADSSATPARTYTLYRAPEFELLKGVDQILHSAGAPNALDLPLG